MVWVRFADLVVQFRFEPKSGKVPYEMTPFGDPGVVANRARLEAWGTTTTLLLSRMGYQSAPHQAEKPFGNGTSWEAGVEHKVQLSICWKVQGIWRAQKFSLYTLTEG